MKDKIAELLRKHGVEKADEIAEEIDRAYNPPPLSPWWNSPERWRKGR